MVNTPSRRRSKRNNNSGSGSGRRRSARKRMRNMRERNAKQRFNEVSPIPLDELARRAEESRHPDCDERNIRRNLLSDFSKSQISDGDNDQDVRVEQEQRTRRRSCRKDSPAISVSHRCSGGGRKPKGDHKTRSTAPLRRSTRLRKEEEVVSKTREARRSGGGRKPSRERSVRMSRRISLISTDEDGSSIADEQERRQLNLNVRRDADSTEEDILTSSDQTEEELEGSSDDGDSLFSGCRESSKTSGPTRSMRLRNRQIVVSADPEGIEERSNVGESQRGDRSLRGSALSQVIGSEARGFGEGFTLRNIMVEIRSLEQQRLLYCRQKLPGLDYECEFCGARFSFGMRNGAFSKNSKGLGDPTKVAREKVIYSKCCGRGSVKVELAKDSPVVLDYLTRYKDVKHYFRWINSRLSFSSTKAQHDEDLLRDKGAGLYTYRVHGQIQHLLSRGLLIPEGQDIEKSVRNASGYVYDNVSLTSGNEIPEKSRQIVYEALEEFRKWLKLFNPYVTMIPNQEVLKRSADPDIEWVLRPPGAENNPMVRTPELDVVVQSRGVIEQTMAVVPRPGDRTFDLPAVDELAMLRPHRNPKGYREIYFRNRQVVTNPEAMQYEIYKISSGHRLYEPLHYVLARPFGETGYHYELGLSGRKYAQYVVNEREWEKGQEHNVTLLNSGRLFHEFLVDMYCRVVESTMRWIAINQVKLRSETYKEIQHVISIMNENRESAKRIGRYVVLPANVQGSPRYMKRQYRKAMRAVLFYGFLLPLNT